MNKLVRMLALSLVAASSFSSCMVETPEDGFEAADQERPVANYQIMGKVTDKDGNPVNGIRVIADYNTDVIYRADTLYTNKEGEYSKFMATNSGCRSLTSMEARTAVISSLSPRRSS